MVAIRNSGSCKSLCCHSRHFVCVWIPSFSSLFFVLIFSKLLWTCLVLSLKTDPRVRDGQTSTRRRRHPARALSLSSAIMMLHLSFLSGPRHYMSKNSAAANGSSQAPRLYSCQCFLPPCTRMSSGSFWSDVCAHARGKPLQTLLISAYASCSVTVRQLCCCCWQPVAPSLQLWIARLPFFFLSCDALLDRLLRIAQAPWRAGTCFACGGEWTRRGGSACGGCTAGSLH